MPALFPSSRHQAALATPTSYRRRSRFTFSRGGVSVNLEPIGGRLTQDSRRKARWDGTLNFAGNDLIPEQAGDILTPFGTHLEVDLGLELLDGSVSYVPYGTYEVAASRGAIDPGSRTVGVNLIDISDKVERYRLETPLSFPTGTDVNELIDAVITDRTGQSPNLNPMGRTIGAPRVVGLDTATPPWSEIQDILKNYAKIAWYDRVGNMQINAYIPNPDTSYPLDDLTSLVIDFDTRPPNVIVARGEAQDGASPVQAVAIDSDPSSPTYAGTGPGTSPYGRTTEFFSSPLLRTEAQAQAAAETILAKNLGAGATYTMTRPYDPTITAGDVVSVRGKNFAVDSITVDITGETTARIREL